MRDLFSCPYCDGDPLEPEHWRYCDGQQGQIEAAEPAAPEPPPVVTLPAHRETSIQAFYNAIALGQLDTQRQKVWSALASVPDVTANELAESVGFRHYFVRNVYARLSELRDMGVVRETGKRRCSLTGAICITWTVVPEADYVGVTIVRRCPTCNQTVSRDVPLVAAK